MVFVLVLALLLATHSTHSMDKKTYPTEILNPMIVPSLDRYLWFVLDRDKKIVEYASKNMEFFCSAATFMHKKMTDVVPLSVADKEAIKVGMRNARKQRQEQVIPYVLEEKRFNAAIKYRSKYEQYRIKVTQ